MKKVTLSLSERNIPWVRSEAKRLGIGVRRWTADSLTSLTGSRGAILSNAIDTAERMTMNARESRYYAGTIDDHGELVSDSLPPRRGDRLIITVINGEIWWDLLGHASMSG